MKNETFDRVKRVACDYASSETKFARSTVVSIDETSDHRREQCYAVKLAMSHTPEEIERLVAESHPDEIEVVREFLKGDFVLNLIVAGNVVVAAEWENMDVC
ncbi:MAG: hypothetical protein ACE37I_14205 [Rubinisphaera brasiliensis]|uniref:hypothetical protein n=1 Tax=Rubinisphaera brasiliensis TaxID=119 RepID=UPI00391A40AD